MFLSLIIAWSIGLGPGAGGPPPSAAGMDWKQYQAIVCLNIYSGHVGLEALGRCHACGAQTPCSNQLYCSKCASNAGVCDFCGKKNTWLKNTDPAVEAPLLLEMLDRSADGEARKVAVHALTQLKPRGGLKRMMKHQGEEALAPQLAAAVGAYGEDRYLPFLRKLLERAGGNYLAEEDSAAQFAHIEASRAAAAALASIGSPRAVEVLLASAGSPRVWEQEAAILALRLVPAKRSRPALLALLKEFFEHDKNWKWIPGRTLIGAALDSLASLGPDRDAALQVAGHLRNPGCDFLNDTLKNALVRLGPPAVPDLIAMARTDLEAGRFGWENLAFIEALAGIRDARCRPLFEVLMEWNYPDPYQKRDFTAAARAGLEALGTP